MIYNFNRQLAEGEKFEQYLDARFAAEFTITQVTREQQRHGIDRIFTRIADGQVFKVEYKADSKAGRTGNAFVETVSVDTTGKPGWAITSKSDILVYLVTEPETVYCIYFQRIRSNLAEWRRKYREVPAMNDGYRTLGLLVPLAEFERIAVRVF